jgi:hypothetical protein
VKRKVTNPLLAFDPSNLRLMTSRENSGQKEAFVRHIETTLGIDYDEYLDMPAGPTTLPAELAQAFRELPLEEDFWAGTFSE